MAAIPVVLNGTFTTDAGSTTGVFLGTLAYSDRAPGGGPIQPPSIWPDPGRPHPEHPIVLPPEGGGGKPPGIWPGGHPEHPIVIPPEQVPPDQQPPQTPPPGTVTPVPPPEGSQGWPVNPMQPPEYLVLNYPGVGPVYVTPPAAAGPMPQR